MTTGIRSFGAYIPKRRMQRGAIVAAHAWSFPSLKGQAKGERSMCSWDEDSITMAVESGRDCLRGAAPGTVGSVVLASTTAPYADLNNAVYVASALRLEASTNCADAGGSMRAGLNAIIEACSASAARDRLVIAAERRVAKPGSVQEMQYGCGSAAFTVGAGGELIAGFLGAETVSVPFIDHFRKAGQEFDYGWEERWVRDEGVSKIVPSAVKALLERLQRKTADVAWFGMAGGPVGSDKLMAKTLGVEADRVIPDLQAQVGDTGCAHAPLLLASALERAKAGDLIVVAAFGQGCQVAAFEMLSEAKASGRQGVAGALGARVEESAYLKLLSFDDNIELEWGMRAETDSKTALTQLYRSANQIFGFVGGKCRACGAVQFPRLPACVNCHAVDSQEPVGLADEPAAVATFTADWLMYTPAPPLYVGLVQFKAGARVLMEIVDVGAAGIEVGTPLKMTFRIKERDRLRNFDRYFWKATPAV